MLTVTVLISFPPFPRTLVVEVSHNKPVDVPGPTVPGDSDSPPLEYVASNTPPTAPEIDPKNRKWSLPPLIHQTWKTTNITSPILTRAISTWLTKNPHFQHRLWTDVECDEFVKEKFPDVWPAYNRLPKPVLKADFFRYLVVLGVGGVYSDIDTECLRPVDGWMDEFEGVRAVVGVEMDASDSWNWWEVIPRQLQFVQWTLAAVPDHPILQNVVSRILTKITTSTNSDLTSTSVMELTGPAIWTDTIYDYMKQNGHEWKEFRFMTEARMVNDTLILPITGFSPENYGMYARGVGDPQARVRHLFYGSWKGDGKKQEIEEGA
ncbi:membrane-bound alpha-1,6- mannosyltransferase Initiation-specific [Quaeritorhiza haematococci]|nr:membrane-bound alpha-1,6- mannosyltransferase Initiation-specific [Quaeritorhiza haematococci]